MNTGYEPKRPTLTPWGPDIGRLGGMSVSLGDDVTVSESVKALRGVSTSLKPKNNLTYQALAGAQKRRSPTTQQRRSTIPNQRRGLVYSRCSWYCIGLGSQMGS